MPEPGSNRGYEAWLYIAPILLMLTGGGRCIEDLREITGDNGLRRLIELKEIPSTLTVGDLLRRQGNGDGLKQIKMVIDLLNQKSLKLDKNNEYTLLSDLTPAP